MTVKTTAGSHGPGRYRRSVDTAQRDHRAAELHARGWSYQRIAAELGFASRGHAHNAVRRAFADIPTEGSEEARRIDLERIDRLIERAWEVMERPHLAISNGRVVRRRLGTERDEAGNDVLGGEGNPVPAYEDVLDDGPTLAAITTITSLLARRARMLGYDAPVAKRIEVITADVIDAEIQRLEATMGKDAGR